MRSRQRLSRDLWILYHKEASTKLGRQKQIYRDDLDFFFHATLPLDVRRVEQQEGDLYNVTFTCDLHPEINHRKALETMRVTGQRRYDSRLISTALVRIPFSYPSAALQVLQWGRPTVDDTTWRPASSLESVRDETLRSLVSVPEFARNFRFPSDIKVHEHLKVSADVAGLTEVTRGQAVNRKFNLIHPSRDMKAVMKYFSETAIEQAAIQRAQSMPSSSDRFDPKFYPWPLTVEWGSPRAMLSANNRNVRTPDRHRLLQESRQTRGVRTIFPLVYP